MPNPIERRGHEQKPGILHLCQPSACPNGAPKHSSPSGHNSILWVFQLNTAFLTHQQDPNAACFSAFCIHGITSSPSLSFPSFPLVRLQGVLRFSAQSASESERARRCVVLRRGPTCILSVLALLAAAGGKWWPGSRKENPRPSSMWPEVPHPQPSISSVLFVSRPLRPATPKART